MKTNKKEKTLRSDIRIQQRAIKVRIYPDEAQQVLLSKTFGCCRYIWNRMLADEQEFYAATDTHFIPTPAKYKTEASFLKEVDSLALANVQIAINKAFTSFFDKNGGYPNWKSKKKAKKSYTTNCQYKEGKATIQLVHGGIRLPKLGVVKANIHRYPLSGWKLKSATVSQTPSGKYFCSLAFEYKEAIPEEVLPTYDSTIGLDYSSPSFYVDDKGNSPDKIRMFRASEEKLAKEERRLSKMKYGSKNYLQQKERVAKLHEHIANQRRDFAHQESRRIANAYDAVCLEDLDLRSIAQSLNLGKSTNDNGFGMFRTFLEYKMKEQGKHVVYVDKWYPSSKTCGCCGKRNRNLKLGDRIWVCKHCGSIILRDKNAARNIKREGLRIFYLRRKAA